MTKNALKIHYIDSFAWGSAHEMFNASLLWMCTQASSVRVTCRATKSSTRAMERLLDKAGLGMQGVVRKTVSTVRGKGRYALLMRYLWGAWLLWWHLVFSVRRSDVAVLPFNNLFALKGINFLCKIFPRKVIVFCHGEMEFVASQVNKKGLLSRLLCRRCLGFFKNPHTRLAPGLYFSVLGSRIDQNLKPLLPESFGPRLFSMAHPYLFFESRRAGREKSGKLTVGTCGAMTVSKGALSMARFAELCRSEGLEIDICHIGVVSSGLREMIQAGIRIPSPDRALTREEFDRQVEQLDYLLFFYGSDNYKITASGAVMDAVALGKPIIALDNDYFHYLFDTFGAFGVLDSSVEDMVAHVGQIERGTLSLHGDFQTIRTRLSPRSILQDFQRMLQKI